MLHDQDGVFGMPVGLVDVAGDALHPVDQVIVEEELALRADIDDGGQALHEGFIHHSLFRVS
jgi:hypothetical protein